MYVYHWDGGTQLNSEAIRYRVYMDMVSWLHDHHRIVQIWRGKPPQKKKELVRIH